MRREFGLKPEHLSALFQKLLEFSAERGFPNCGACHLGKLVTELDVPNAGCKPRSLSGLLALLTTWALEFDNRGIKVPHRESVVTEEDIAAAGDILDADEAEASMEEAEKKTGGEDQVRGSGVQAQKHYRRESQRPTKKLFFTRRQQQNLQDPAHPRHLLPQPMRHRPRQQWCASTRMRTLCRKHEI